MWNTQVGDVQSDYCQENALDCVFNDLFAVCPATEMTVFHDGFFKSMDIVVNALDNVAARQYMDR